MILKFLLLPYQKKKLLSQSLIVLWVIRLSLWVLPFKVLNRWLSNFGVEDGSELKVGRNVIDSVTSAVKVCSRYVPYATCLPQALATRLLLGLKGQPSQLKIGVDKDEEGQFLAHAWVEINDKIIIGKLPNQPRYNVLKSTDSAQL